MFRRRKKTKSSEDKVLRNGIQKKRESSRLSPLVMSNPVNQSAQWSHIAYLLEDLVKQFELPRIVRCASRLLPGEDTHLPINVHVPMLLCKGRKAMKLLAKHVGMDVRTNRLVETDDTIAIPNDYGGHFVRLLARTSQDRSVVRSLADIAHGQAPAFLNFTPLTSFSYDGFRPGDTATPRSSFRSSQSSSKQQRLIHQPGCVFVVTNVLTGQVMVNRRPKAGLFLCCNDETGFGVLIPVDQPCEVVGVELPPNGSTKLSQLPQDLMASKRYPGLVRYVYGSNPPRLTPCSRIFTLIDTFEEESLIGCLLYPNHALMIELPKTSSLGFEVAMNHEEVMSLPLPRHALSVVDARRDTFVTDLKLKCKFMHRVNQGLIMAGNTSVEAEEELVSATVRTRQYANEAFFYL